MSKDHSIHSETMWLLHCLSYLATFSHKTLLIPWELPKSILSAFSGCWNVNFRYFGDTAFLFLFLCYNSVLCCLGQEGVRALFLHLMLKQGCIPQARIPHSPPTMLSNLPSLNPSPISSLSCSSLQLSVYPYLQVIVKILHVWRIIPCVWSSSIHLKVFALKPASSQEAPWCLEPTSLVYTNSWHSWPSTNFTLPPVGGELPPSSCAALGLWKTIPNEISSVWAETDDPSNFSRVLLFSFPIVSKLQVMIYNFNSQSDKFSCDHIIFIFL